MLVDGSRSLGLAGAASASALGTVASVERLWVVDVFAEGWVEVSGTAASGACVGAPSALGDGVKTDFSRRKNPNIAGAPA